MTDMIKNMMLLKEKFDLERVSDVLWLKFTDKGHLAVVAKSCDINWDSKQSCGLLVQEIGDLLIHRLLLCFH